MSREEDPPEFPPTAPTDGQLPDPNRLRFGIDIIPRYTRPSAKCFRFDSISDQAAVSLGIPEGGLSWCVGADPSMYVEKPLLWDTVKSVVITLSSQPPDDSRTGDRRYDSDLSELEDARWGDCIDFGHYRGCGIWFIGGPHWDPSQWRLLKTYGEMGYARPLEFYDCPIPYYERLFARDIGIYEELFDLSRLWGLPESRAKTLQKRIAEIRTSTTYTPVGTYDYRVTSLDIDRSKFPNGGYWGLLEHHGAVDESCSLQIVPFYPFGDTPSDHEGVFVGSYEARLRRVEWDSLVVLALTLRHVVPWELCRVIVEFAVSF